MLLDICRCAPPILQSYRETDRFFAASGVQLPQRDLPVPLPVSGVLLSKEATLRINLNIDGTPIDSKSHTHPSHS